MADGPVASYSRIRRLRMRRRSNFSRLVVAAYRIRLLRPAIRVHLRHFEGGLMFSPTWRIILEHYEGVTLGDYSYGPGLRPGLFDPGTQIGRFSSFAEGLRVLRRNHPTDRISQHPLFFNAKCGLLSKDSVPSPSSNRLIIGHDVWIGMDVLICPGCHEIGNGAIIGAGAVVTKDVPPFTIVAGIPAQTIRKRFSPEVEIIVARSNWWLSPLPEILKHLDLFTTEVSDGLIQKFRAAFPAAEDAHLCDKCNYQ